MTIEEKLDLILNEAKDQYGHLPISANWEKICRRVTDGNGITTGNPDYQKDPFFKMLVQGLTDEKYIQTYTNDTEIPALTYNVATVKGLTFIGFKKAKKINDGAKGKETKWRIGIALGVALVTVYFTWLLSPAQPVLKQETIVLPEIQIVHDTIVVKSALSTNDSQKMVGKKSN
jgi:hypothetical protein